MLSTRSRLAHPVSRCVSSSPDTTGNANLECGRGRKLWLSEPESLTQQLKSTSERKGQVSAQADVAEPGEADRGGKNFRFLLFLSSSCSFSLGRFMRHFSVYPVTFSPWTSHCCTLQLE